jgi:hypothetical protein
MWVPASDDGGRKPKGRAVTGHQKMGGRIGDKWVFAQVCCHSFINDQST